jgi:SpoIID/LytB domain protein
MKQFNNLTIVKKTVLSLLLFFLVIIFYSTTSFVFSKSIDEMSLEEIEQEIANINAAIDPLKQESSDLANKIAEVQSRIVGVEQRVRQLAQDIEERTDELVYQKAMFEERVRSQYIKQRISSSPLLTIFAGDSQAADLAREVSFARVVAKKDKDELIAIAENLIQLKHDKESLEKVRQDLAAAKTSFSQRREFLEGEIESAEQYKAQLSAKQKELIARRQASLNLPSSLGAGPLRCVDDRNIDPGFRPAFAFFTFGIPHRVGMNQYGAFGRASAGQSYDQILRAYYNFDDYSEVGDVTIRVNNGNNVNEGSVIWSGDLEDYVKRIYEVPSSWPLESLKAQAIAARSYVLAVTNNGNNSICANQYCQVFKSDPKGGAWDQAVSETTGKVMILKGEIITAWYASTSGGYTFTSADVWGGSRAWTKRMRDTSGDITSFEELKTKAYDRESPCFYSAQGTRGQYNSSAWLKTEEVADIVNVLLLAKKDPSTADHLYQEDKAHPYGGEIWNRDRARQELRSRGANPFSKIDNISVSGVDLGIGRTLSLNVSGDAGSITVDANEFRDYFNLRAPANIQIVGPLFNIEKK